MTTQELIFNYLQAQGLVPTKEEFGISFKFQMANFIIIDNDSDQQFLQIIMPGIFEATAENRVELLEACNKINDDTKLAKVVIWDNGSVSINAELLLDSNPAFDDLLPRSLKILLYTRDKFHQLLEG